MSDRTRPRVLHVGNFLSARGFNRQFIEDLADRQERDGWEVLRTSGVVSRPRRLFEMAAVTWRQRRQYDVAHVTVFSGPSFVWAELATLVLRLARRPIVLSLRGGNLPEFAHRWPRRVRRLLRVADQVVAPSRYLGEHVAPYRPAVVLISNPIEVDRYPFRVRGAPSPRLVWLRAFHAIYNPELAPRVLARLAPEYPDSRLVMIGPDMGDGSLERTRAVARELGVIGRVEFAGRVSKGEVPERLASADVFLNTTNVDNAPISVIEALACGLCVVSTNVGGVPYLLDDEQDALLVPPGDAPAMAAAITRILREPGLAERLSTAGRTKAETMDWSRVLPRWDEVLRRAAGVAG